MKIPKELNLDYCNSCRKELKTSDYKRCGATLNKPVLMYFDYECSNCTHVGRYVLPVAAGISSVEALLELAKLIDDPITEKPQKQAQMPSKENIKSELNKIVGVNDLLKLGGKNAPKEPPSTNPGTAGDGPIP